MKDAKAAAEAKLDEFLEESTNSNAVLRAELEEESKARKAAEGRVALLTAEQKEYDRVVLQTDALALRKSFSFLSSAYKLSPSGNIFLPFLLSPLTELFPDSQRHAHKKVMERRIEQSMSNPEAPWDAYDYLVALSARIQHMRAMDRHPVDLPTWR
jgi:hypothetical protein